MESVIEVRGLALAFGEGPSATTVFSDIDLTVAAGEFLVIVGASGVGKSTLLRALAGLIPATSGRVLLHTPADPARLPVALAFQDARLLPWRRVLENVKFGIERLAVGGKERSERAAAALDLVGLSALAQRWPHQLSGGQRQRVALARALAVQPYRTSRSGLSTRLPASRCRMSCCGFGMRRARRSFSSPTISPRPCTSPIAWSCLPGRPAGSARPT